MARSTPNSETLTYINVYRMGGYLNAEWRAALPVYGATAARKQADDVRRMGYKVLTKTLTEHQAIGMPVGYCAKCDPVTGECRRKTKECRDI